MKFTKKTWIVVGITGICGVLAFLFVPYQQDGGVSEEGFTTQSYERGSRYTPRSTSRSTSSNRSYSSNYSRYTRSQSKTTTNNNTPKPTQKADPDTNADAKFAAYQQQQAKKPTYSAKPASTSKPVVTSSITTSKSSSSSSSSSAKSSNGSNTGSSTGGSNNPPVSAPVSAPASAPANTNPANAGDIVYPNKGNASSLFCQKRNFNIAYNTKFNDDSGNEYKLKYGTKSFVSEMDVVGVKKTLTTGGLECKYSPNEVKDKTFELTLRYTSPCSETSEGNFSCSGGRQTSCPDISSSDFIRNVSHPQNDVQGQRFNWEEDTLNDMHNKSTVTFIQAYGLPSGNSTNITCQYELDIDGNHFKKDTHISPDTDTKDQAYRIKSICPAKVEGNLNGFIPKGYVPGGSVYRDTNRYAGHNRHRCFYKDTYGQDVPNPLTKSYDISELTECSGTLTTDKVSRELRCKLK